MSGDDTPRTAGTRANWTIESQLIASGRDRTRGAPLNVPPVFASNFYLPDERLYSRTNGTPTTDALEAASNI